MNQRILDFLHTYPAVTQQHLYNLCETLEEAYVEYDSSHLEAELDRLTDVEVDPFSVADAMREMIAVDAYWVLTLSGILVQEHAALSTLDALMQMVTGLSKEGDTEDLLDILSTDDAIEAVATLAVEVAYGGESVDGYSKDSIMADIEKVETVAIQLLKEALSDEEPAVELSPTVLRYLARFPLTQLSEMVSPPSVLATGGSIEMYTRLFDSSLQLDEQTGALDIVNLLIGILVISNADPSTYIEELEDLMAHYLEPQLMATRAAYAHYTLRELMSD